MAARTACNDRFRAGGIDTECCLQSAHWDNSKLPTGLQLFALIECCDAKTVMPEQDTPCLVGSETEGPFRWAYGTIQRTTWVASGRPATTQACGCFEPARARDCAVAATGLRDSV
jgi:hypothetical protein